MKSKILLIITSLVLMMSLPFPASAEEDIPLTRYEGYNNAYIQHVLDLHYHVSAKYTDNKEQAQQLYDDFRNHLATNGFMDKISQKLEGLPLYDKAVAIERELLSTLLGLGGTAFDYVKEFFGLFKGASNEQEYVVKEGYPLVAPDGYVFHISTSEWLIDTAEAISYYHNGYCTSFNLSFTTNKHSSSTYSNITASIYFKDSRCGETWSKLLDITYAEFNQLTNVNGNYEEESRKKIAFIAKHTGVTITLVKKDTGEREPLVYPTINNDIQTINNYIQEGNTIQHIPTNYKPNIKSYLVCGEQIHDLTITGNTFTTVDGTVIEVAEDETAILNGVNCNLQWKIPTVEIDENENIIIKQDGESDLNLDDLKNQVEMPECDGVLCWLTNIFKHIASIPMAIISGLLDGLTGLLKTLFVPSADSFKNFISSLNTTISEKMNAPTLANIFTEISPKEAATSFEGIKVSGLMGTGEVTMIDSSSINSVLPTIHSWIKGFFYVLLALFNINHLYRLIRGTTIFESMRGKTE